MVRRAKIGLRYAMAVAVIAVAYAVQAAIFRTGLPPSPALLFYPAIFAVAWSLMSPPFLLIPALTSESSRPAHDLGAMAVGRRRASQEYPFACASGL